MDIGRAHKPVLAVLAAVCSLSACASLYQDRIQYIQVNSSPIYATVSVNGQRQGSTPAMLTLPKAKKIQVIRIESPGYNPVEVRVRRRPLVMPYLMDAVLGVIAGTLYELGANFRNDERDSSFGVSVTIGIGIPVLIDLVSGKAQSLSPKELRVTLTKANGPPRVETVYIDPGDVRDIKRIWVRRD